MKKRMKWYGVGLLMLVVTQIISTIIFNLLGIGGSTRSLDRLDEIINHPGIILITLALSPIIEEFIFRFLLYRKNMRQPYDILTALFSSILFGLIHDQSIVMTIPLILNGLIYCLIYKKSESIWISILVHSTYNALIFIILYLSIK